MRRLPFKTSSSLPIFIAQMDVNARNLTWAIMLSVTLHMIILSLNFQFPDPTRFKFEQTLDIILVNSKSKDKPNKAQALAQTNLDGGGNADDQRRAKSPLPTSAANESGDALIQAKKKIKQLEEERTALMTQIKSEKTVKVDTAKTETKPHTQIDISGLDLLEASKAMARMEAQIAKQIEDYNSRPRRTNISPRVRESHLAFYYAQWREKVEKVGSLNYPEEAKGRIYGSLVLTVWILADGSVEKVEIDRASGYKVLDAAALRIIKLAAPFAKLTPDILKNTDILSITSTWTFAPGDQLFSE